MFTCVRPGFSAHELVAVTVVLPASVALPGVKVKFTLPAERLIVSDSASWAFKVMGWAPELICADARDVIATTTANRPIFPNLLILLSLLCFQPVSSINLRMSRNFPPLESLFLSCFRVLGYSCQEHAKLAPAPSAE